MPLHYTRDGYTFRVNAQRLAIEPGLKPITLSRDWLAQLGLQPRDDYRIPIHSAAPKEDVTGRIPSALNEAISRCRGPEGTWIAQDLKRAMILIGGLDDEVAEWMLDQEGV